MHRNIYNELKIYQRKQQNKQERINDICGLVTLMLIFGALFTI